MAVVWLSCDWDNGNMVVSPGCIYVLYFLLCAYTYVLHYVTVYWLNWVNTYTYRTQWYKVTFFTVPPTVIKIGSRARFLSTPPDCPFCLIIHSFDSFIHAAGYGNSVLVQSLRDDVIADLTPLIIVVQFSTCHLLFCWVAPSSEIWHYFPHWNMDHHLRS